MRTNPFGGALALPLLLCAAPALADNEARSDTGTKHEKIVVTGQRVALTSPDAALATTNIDHTPGGVEIVSDTAFKDTPVQNIKDILAYVPGVVTQPRMGDDARISIRGSGLSRAYGGRGVTLYLDGIPLNTSDGLYDLFEIDPTAYRYVEVYKGGNALRYGSNALGGAINLVTPTGRDTSPLDARIDVGSFGYVKGAVSTGGSSGAFDWFATASAQRIDGYREHSNGDAFRGNLNLGYQFSPDVETRLYIYGASTDQHIPGEVTKAEALDNPKAANPVWIAQNQQRNVDSIRVADKTTFRFGDTTTLDLGVFYNHRHVDHPIYQYLDYTVDDYGGFVRAVDDRALGGGMRNRLILGANIQDGTIDTKQYVNVAATKGALTASMVDTPRNVSGYAEDSLYLQPNLALIAGVQYLHASRDRRDRFLSDGDQSGSRTYDLWSPRAGLLWSAANWQVFANVSRSAEVPSYDANVVTTPDLKAQRATTYEIGTRGRSGGLGWDVSLYRSDITNELQCLTTAPWALCSIVNAGKTVHQGIEAGLDADVPLSGRGDKLARDTD